MCRCNISFDRRLDGAHCSVWTHTEWWWIPLFFHLHYRLIGSCYIVVFSCSCIVKPSGVPSIIMWRSYLVFASRGWESTSIMEQVIQIIICWLKFALSKKNIKLVLAQRIYIRKSPIPVQLQPLHYVKNISMYSLSATPGQMIRAHNFRFTKLPKAYSSM